MPRLVTLELWWRERQSSPTYYDMYLTDIEEMMRYYGRDGQSLLFTFVDMDTWKRWVSIQLCREPERMEINAIEY